MDLVLALVMADGCVTDLVEVDGQLFAGFRGTGPECPLMTGHIATAMVMLRRPGGSRWPPW